MAQLSHGSQWLDHNESQRTLVDKEGNKLIELQMSSDKFQHARFRLPSNQWVVLRASENEIPILGAVHSISQEGIPDPIAWVQATDWLAPGAIPAVDCPGRLPPGVGSAILNFLSIQAQPLGAPLRYGGPYPTASLFDTLFQSFTIEGDLQKAYQTFTENVQEQAIRGESTQRPVDFIAHPFEWVWLTPEVCIQLRDGLESVYINGKGYHRNRAGSRRLLPEADGWVATVQLAGHPWTQRALFDSQGNLQSEVAALPTYDAQNDGQALPDSLRAVLIKALIPKSPDLLKPALELILKDAPIQWGNTEEEAAISDATGIKVHAALQFLLRNQDPATILNTLCVAIEPAATRLAQTVLEHAHSQNNK